MEEPYEIAISHFFISLSIKEKVSEEMSKKSDSIIRGGREWWEVGTQRKTAYYV